MQLGFIANLHFDFSPFSGPDFTSTARAGTPEHRYNIDSHDPNIFPNFSTCAVRFLALVVGWVERQKNGGFRCYNLILYTSHNMQAMCN